MKAPYPVGATLLFVAALLVSVALPWKEGEPLLVLPLIVACVFAGAGLAVLWRAGSRISARQWAAAAAVVATLFTSALLPWAGDADLATACKREPDPRVVPEFAAKQYAECIERGKWTEGWRAALVVAGVAAVAALVAAAAAKGVE